MAHLLKILLLLSLLTVPASAGINIDYNDANCMGAFLMEDVGNETDEAKGNTLTETGGTIARDADRQFGDWSRVFVASETEFLTHADNLDTDIFGANQPISIVFWMKSAETSVAGDQSIVAKYNRLDNNRQYIVRIDNSSAEVIIFALSSTGSSATSCIGATKVTTQAYIHVGCVYDDTDQRIYINGVLDSNGASNPFTYSSGIAEKTAAFTIGSRNDSSPQYYDGKLDDAGIFDIATDSTEVNDIMDNGLSPVAITGAGQVIMIMG